MKKTIALVLCVIMLLAFGCKAAPQEPVKVGALKGPTGMGIAYVMKDNTDAASVELFDAPDAVTGKYISGEIDIAAVPINLAAALYNKTEGDTVILAVNTLGVLYVVENGDTVQSINDLSGKTIYATGQGSTPEYILNDLLEKNGITDATVEYVGEHATLATMVASGEAPLAMLPEPNVSVVTMKNPDSRVALDLTAEWSKVSDTQLVQGCYIAKKSYVEANGKAVEAFLKNLSASVDKVNQDAGAAAVIAELGILPSEQIASAAIPRCNIVCITGAEMKAAASGMIQVLFDANPKSVGGALPGDDLYGA